MKIIYFFLLILFYVPFGGVAESLIEESFNYPFDTNMDVDELRVFTEWLKLTEATAPVTPESLTASADGSIKIILSWTDKSINESGFSIKRSPDGVTFIPLDTAAANARS